MRRVYFNVIIAFVFICASEFRDYNCSMKLTVSITKNSPVLRSPSTVHLLDSMPLFAFGKIKNHITCTNDQSTSEKRRNNRDKL
jgi:hypothetical protein